MERELAQQAEHRARPEVRERRLAANRRHKAANLERRREVAKAYRARPEVRERERQRKRRRCKHCGKSIRHLNGNAKFCSKECWIQKRRIQKRRKIRFCKECGVDITDLHGGARFCSRECQGKSYAASPEAKAAG